MPRRKDDRSGAARDKDSADRKDKRESSDDGGFSLSPSEKADVEEKLPPRAAVLHEAIRMEGEAELKRNFAALAWSALAAGLSMGFSMLVRGLLLVHLPDTPARFLIAGFGYSAGFLIVVLARQQLFTENTMTAVLPFMTRPGWCELGKLLRLWTIVLIGNLIGIAIFAYAIGHMQLFDATTYRAFVGMGEEIMRNSALQMFTKGIFAGWLISTMVWLVPAAENAKAAIIILMTWFIAIGGFTHIIVGATEVLYLVFSGQLDVAAFFWPFALPTLAGNILGGSVMFALINHAQVRSDEAR